MDNNIVLSKMASYLIVQLALINVKINMIHPHCRVRENKRKEIYIISAEIEKPAYIIE